VAAVTLLARRRELVAVVAAMGPLVRLGKVQVHPSAVVVVKPLALQTCHSCSLVAVVAVPLEKRRISWARVGREAGSS
jgi:hypothetical protein